MKKWERGKRSAKKRSEGKGSFPALKNIKDQPENVGEWTPSGRKKRGKEREKLDSRTY